MKRKIVQIDQDKCNGCGLCIDACHERAIELVDGKARLVGDIYCDGLGDCLGECPQDAIRIVERDAEEYDEAAVRQRIRAGAKSEKPPAVGGGCPGVRMIQFDDPESAATASKASREAAGQPPAPSALRQWPIQLSLVPENAPYWQDAEILVSADCVAYALGDFADRLLRGRRLVVACPKLDQRTGDYVEKLTAIIRDNPVRGLAVAYMEVPCCHGMRRIAEEALAASGKALPLRLVKVGLRGDILEDHSL